MKIPMTASPPAVQNPDGSITVAVSMTYDADNRLLTYNGQIVEYDAVGNMTRGPLNGAMADFTYDCRNRLVKVKESDGTITEYEYDAENIRTAVISGDIKTVYATDRESTYSQTLVKTQYEKNTWGQYTEEVSETMYTYGLGLIGERRDNNQEFYYHYNHVGSTMAVTDADGIVYYRFIYDTYGELSDITTDDGVSLKSSEQLTEYRLAELAHATGIDYLYNGQYGVETDANGLYYMRARYYNQDIKRFINRDVVSGDISNSQSLNRYCYVQGNPVSLTDPFGLCPDPNSGFKNFCKALYYTDWSTVGHAALSAVGVFWDGADVINMFWYMAEKKWDQAAECAIYALPVMGSFAGSLLMKGNKASKFGSALKTVSQLTQGSIGICCGVDMTITGITNIVNGIEAGSINAEDILMTIGGITATAIWGKSVLPSGGIKRITNSISDVYKTKKADRLSELGKQGRVIDADISPAPVGGGSNTSINNNKRLYRVMSEGELEAVKSTGMLRGGREGTTYFTDSYFRNANKAKSRLALPEKPSYIVEFEIKNNPNISGGTKVQPAFGEVGGGREYFTDDIVEVDIINYQKMIGGG